MALSTQYFSYSVSTGDFDTPEERKLYDKMMLYKRRSKGLSDLKDRMIKECRVVRGFEGNTQDENEVRNAVLEKYKQIMRERKLGKHAAEYKEKYSEALKLYDGVRELSPVAICEYNQISLFESILSRTLGIKPNETTMDLITVQVYFYTTMEQLIKRGFTYNGERYQYYTSSAAAIRLKKGMFIKSSTYEKHKMALTCGMPVEEINKRTRINATKFLAYTALPSSAVDVWPTDFVEALRMGIGSFNIRKCIVVPDYEMPVKGIVDHLNNETYEITRQEMDVVFDRVDGCGMVLPRVCDKNFVFRAPWMKGLLCSFDFVRFIEENYASQKVVDFWGKEWNVIDDEIEVIFTDSMLKLAKCYKSWDEYCTYFEQYGCLAGIANMEGQKPLRARFNYQYLQSLTDITDDEIRILTMQSNNTLREISSDKETMLRVLGATDYNADKTPYQEALSLYPELLKDEYAKKKLRDAKNSLVKKFKSAKLESRGYFTFVIPDLYAFCEKLFLGIERPQGLLRANQCSCKLLSYSDELVAMRSPALYREQVVLKNIHREDPRIQDYFDTDAIYISNHDMLARVVQLDYDGDRLMVTADPTFREIVKRNWRNDDIVPLYFDLKHAEGVELTPDNLWIALQRAFQANKIGVYANLITKAWNSAEDWLSMSKEDRQLILDVVKYLTLEENINIDSAKSGYNMTRTDEVDKKIKDCIGGKKVPYFFRYAKDRGEEQVEEWNTSVINRIGAAIINPRIRFVAENLGKLDWRNLVSNPNIKVNEEIIGVYTDIVKKSHTRLTPPKSDSREAETNYYAAIKNLQDEFKKRLPEYSWTEISDVVFKYLYYVRKNVVRKDFAWAIFGEAVVENIKKKVPKESIQCDICGTRFVPNTISSHQKYCIHCAKDIRKAKNREYKRKMRQRAL